MMNRAKAERRVLKVAKANAINKRADARKLQIEMLEKQQRNLMTDTFARAANERKLAFLRAELRKLQYYANGLL